MNKIVTILVLLLSYYNGNSQTPELADEYWNKAEKAVELEDWENAAKWYEKSAEVEKKSPTPRLEDLVFELNNAAFYYNKNKNYNREYPDKNVLFCIVFL